EQLKREQADYVNSRRRIEAQAEAGKEMAVGRVLTSLIGVLDDVELGRQHGDIAEGTPFHAIAQKLEDALATNGLEHFGAVGDQFDPNVHEALRHEEADDVEVPTVSLVMQPGYRMHERTLRPDRVGTRDPAGSAQHLRHQAMRPPPAGMQRSVPPDSSLPDAAGRRRITRPNTTGSTKSAMRSAAARRRLARTRSRTPTPKRPASSTPTAIT